MADLNQYLKKHILLLPWQVTLTKKSGSEEVMVTLNVNHTVDSAAPDDGTGEVRGINCKGTAALLFVSGS